jgi:hypothetical protein
MLLERIRRIRPKKSDNGVCQTRLDDLSQNQVQYPISFFLNFHEDTEEEILSKKFQRKTAFQAFAAGPGQSKYEL